MLIIPAIDLLDGKVVRLEQGNYQRVKVYSEDPIEIARRWKDKGAGLIHIVDLDGARDGKPKNLESVGEIIKTIGIDVELGGGIRNFETIEKVFDIGASKAVLGTAAIIKRNFSHKCITKYSGEKIIFSLDAKNKQVFSDGWGLDSGYVLNDLIKEFDSMGLKRIIYTDIMKDGMMTGPNMQGIKDVLKATNLEVIASGGISSIDDIKRLKMLEGDGLEGVIIGKALYEGRIDLAQAIEEAEKNK